MEETRHIRKEDVLSRGIKKEQIIHSGPEENLSLQGKSAIKTAAASKKVATSKIAPIETKGAINQNIETDKPVVYKHARLAKLPFNRGLFYQMYEQMLTLPADCQGKEDTCYQDCPYCHNGECMYYRLKGFVEDNPDVLGDIEPELSTDFIMT